MYLIQIIQYLQYVIHLDGLRSCIIFTVENYFSVNKTRSKQTDPLMFLNVELKYNHVFLLLSTLIFSDKQYFAEQRDFFWPPQKADSDDIFSCSKMLTDWSESDTDHKFPLHAMFLSEYSTQIEQFFVVVSYTLKYQYNTIQCKSGFFFTNNG